MGVFRNSLVFVGLAMGLACVSAQAQSKDPVFIGIDEAYSIKTNTAPRAIERGAQAAIAEINARGGVLGGRH